MKRVFDILTAPFSAGPCSAKTSISWANPRNFTIEVAPQIAGSFKVISDSVESAHDERHDYLVELEYIGSAPTRFAALVTCDTDEPDPQTEDSDALIASIRASWDSLDKVG